MRDHYGWMDTPLSTQEDDHPVMMKLKNIVEGMGIGLVFDGALWHLQKVLSQLKHMYSQRGKTVNAETLAKTIQEYETVKI